MKKFFGAILFLMMIVVVAQAETLKLPESLTVIEKEAFMNVNANNVVLPEGIKRIDSKAFANSKFTTIVLPSTLQYIAEDAFDSSELRIVEASKDSYAYEWAVKKGYIVPSPVEDFSFKQLSVNSCEVSSYNGCDETVVIPSTSSQGWKVSAIGNNAFNGNDAIRKVSIPEGVQVIGVNAFSCHNLSSVQLPSTITTINRNAFNGAGSNLQNYVLLYLPDNIVSVAKNATDGYYGEMSIFRLSKFIPVCNKDSKTAHTLSDASYDFALDGHEDYMCRWTTAEALTLTKYRGESEQANIPNGIHVIGDSAFQFNDKLKKVTIPEGVQVIGVDAFRCDNLSSVQLPSTITTINRNAFNGAGSNLQNYVLLYLPDNIVSVAKNATDGYYGEMSIFRLSKFIPVCNKDSETAHTLSDASYDFALDGHEDYMCRWTTAEALTLTKYRGESEQANIPNGIHVIGDSAFLFNDKLKKVTIPEGVQVIGVDAFRCSNLSSVQLPSTITTIKRNAFNAAGSNLQNNVLLYLPDNIVSVAKDATDGYYGEMSIFRMSKFIPVCEKDSQTAHTLSDNNYTFALSGQTSFRCRWINNKLTLISYVGNAARFNVPYGIENIGNSVFSGNKSAEVITLPTSISSIGSDAFRGCNNLRAVFVYGMNVVLDSNVFYYCSDLIVYGYHNSGLKEYIDTNYGSKQVRFMPINGTLPVYNQSQNEYTFVVGRGMSFDITQVFNPERDAHLVYTQSNPVLLSSIFPGMGRAKYVGETTLTRSDGQDPVCNIKVIGLPDDTLTLFTTMTMQLTPVLIDGYIGEDWSSSDNSVVTVDENGLVTCVGAGRAIIRMTMSNGLYSTTEITVRSIPSGISVKPEWMALGMGESEKLKVVCSSGANLEYVFKSSNPLIAKVDEEGCVHGQMPGVAEITVSLAVNESVSVSCPIMVLKYHYEKNNFLDYISKQREFLDMLLRGHHSFDGGYADSNGEWVDPIDYMNLTDSFLSKAYADLVGTNSGTPVEIFTEASLAAESIMSALTKMNVEEQEIGLKELNDIMTELGTGANMINDFLTFAHLNDSDANSIPLKHITANVYEQWLEQNVNVELPFVDEISKAAEKAMAIVNIIKSYAEYSTVDQARLKQVIDGLWQSEDENAKITAGLLDLMSTRSGLITYLCATNGASAAQKALLKETKKIGIELLQAIPTVGFFFKGMAIGKDVGTTVNNALMNIDDIQSAAYKLKYAVTMAKGMEPTLLSAYNAYMECPVDISRFDAFYQAADAFGQFVYMEYDNMGKLSKAYEESTLQKLKNFLKNPLSGNYVDDSLESSCNRLKGYYASVVPDYLNMLLRVMPNGSSVVPVDKGW